MAELINTNVFTVGENGSKKFVDFAGLDYFWEKAKQYIDTADGNLSDGLAGIDVEYDGTNKLIYLTDANGNKVGDGFDASSFIIDGMLESVSFEEVDGVKTNNLVFVFNTDAGKEEFTIDFSKYVDVYKADGSSIELDSTTNTFSVKNVDASKATLGNSIQIAGGPLANDIAESTDVWPDGWTDESGNKIIPSGKSMEEILTALFLKVVNGTVSWGTKSWNPSLAAPTATLSGAATVEVGTTLTATVDKNSTVSGNKRSCSLTASHGYFESLDGAHKTAAKTVSVDGTKTDNAAITWTWNGTATTDTSLVVVEGTNTLKVSQSGVTVSVDALPETTVYASTNTKSILKDVKATLTDTKPDDKALTSSKSDTVTGAYKAFIGYVDAIPTDSAGVRALNNGTKLGKGAVGAANTVYTIDKNYMVVALPSGWDFTIQNSLGQDAQRNSFALSGTVNVVLPDNTTKVYNVYSIGWKDGQYKNLIIK